MKKLIATYLVILFGAIAASLAIYAAVTFVVVKTLKLMGVL